MISTLFNTALTGIIFFTFSNAKAAETTSLGQGKNTCSEYITVVDGNWSHPLNALNFHGYVSWAQGMISGYNKYNGETPFSISTEELKLSLVDYCRDNPESTFAEAVESTIP